MRDELTEMIKFREFSKGVTKNWELAKNLFLLTPKNARKKCLELRINPDRVTIKRMVDYE